MTLPACALTIAGTDPSGGAGIQADLKTFQELKTYGMSVITSIVAQNTTGVKDIHDVPLSMIKKQLDAVISDMPIHAVKTGMIANVEMMKLVVRKLKSRQIPFVIDPVMVATSGDALIDEQARIFLRDHLLPLATVVTPNIPEAEFLTGINITTNEDMIEAAQKIVHQYGAGAVLVKGGHTTGDAIDYLYDGETVSTFLEKRINTVNTHGTGCTLSAAITAYLAQGDALLNAVEKGKVFVTEAIKQSFDLGAGSGPTNHFAVRENA